MNLAKKHKLDIIYSMADSGLSENDPYREMNTGEDEIRPVFLSGVRDWADNAAYRLNGEDYDKDEKKIRKQKAAGRALGVGEKTAVSEGGEFKNNLSGLRDRESAAPGIINSVKGKSGKDGGGKGRFGGKGKINGKGFLKKAGPIAIIGGIFAVVAGMMVGAQNVMPIAIEEMIIEKFNSIGISSTMASDEWLDIQLNQGVREGNPKNNEPETMYAFSEYQVQQFEKYGITVVNGDGVTALLYEKDGQYIPVVGSATLGSMSESEIIGKIQSASGLGNIGAPISAKEALADANFKNPYTTASKAWRGGASGWFDKIMSGVTEPKLGISRNRWMSYVSKGIKSLTHPLAKQFKEVARNNKKISDEGTVVNEEYEETNSDGETVNKTKPIDEVKADLEGGGEEDIDTTVKNTSADDIKSKAEAEGVFKSKAAKVASTVAEAADSIATTGCAVLKGVISIYDIVAAQQKLQFLNLISGFLEAVDKVKAGDDTGSPIHLYAESLTTKADTVDDNGEVVREDKTAMESAGMAWLFGNNSVISQSDPSVRNVNFESIMSNISWITDKIEFTTEVFEACGYAKIASGAFNVGAAILSIATGGFTKFVEGIIKPAKKQIIKGIIWGAIQIIIPIAAKNYAKMLLNDVATEWFGEDLGNGIISGAGLYLGGNGSSGGQGPGSETKVADYLGAKDTVIAQEAEYQRAIRSPFDITSKYTFLGSLVFSMLPLAYSSGITANFNKISNLTSSSMIALLPTASAISSNSVKNSTGDCGLLESSGAIGDAFCNPYIITDVSTMNTSPVAVNDIVHKIGGDTTIASVDDEVAGLGNNFDSNGKIVDGSELSKYVVYCGQRTSQYGLYDAAITSQLTGEDTTVSKIMDAPLLSDFKDIVTGGIEVANQRYITGESCVASDDDYWQNENRWYQRYVENQRLLESMNPGYTSEVTAYLDDYYTVNPLDQSLEGTLARFTGMTKEEVEDTFALIEYFEFLDEYDATERYAFGDSVVEEGKELRFVNENNVAENVWVVLLNQISYADVRNRSFAV